MLCGNTELVDEHLSFGDEDVYDVEARREWLNDELELIAQLRANRLSAPF
jgi:hypothetical protein